MKYLCSFTLGINTLCSLAFAGSLGETSATSSNQTGYFIGIGGAYTNANLRSNASGILNAGSGSPPLSQFIGSTSTYRNTANTVSPEVQVGYFKHFNSSDWLWGLEFLYQYSNLNIKTHDAGGFINLSNPSGVTDLLTVSGLRTHLNDTLMLPIFIGHSFRNSFIYAGAGPSLFYTTQQAFNINDTQSAYYIGDINNFSKNQWIWGGAVQAGMAYYINPTWFLKLNYSCAFTGNYTINNPVAFLSGINYGLNAGTLTFNTKENLVTQEVAFSINKVF